MILKFLSYVLWISSSYSTDTHMCHVPRINQDKVNAMCITHEKTARVPSQLFPGSYYDSKIVTIYYEYGHGKPINTVDPETIEMVENI